MRYWMATAAVLALGGAATGGQAAQFVTNGGFEITTLPISSEFGGQFPTQQVMGWQTNGYNFVYRPGEADAVGATGTLGNVRLWGPLVPAGGPGNGLTATSPAGGNFIAADPAFIASPIMQMINGLTVGATYDLSFYYAGAQQWAFAGATTEGWHVTFGAQTYDAPVINLVHHGFSGWRQVTTSFTATSTSQVLSFLATGGPTATQPPFSLLDGVSLTDRTRDGGGVPEPAAWGLMILGFGAVGAAVRRRRVIAT